MSDRDRQARWRLVLGAGADDLCGGLGGAEEQQDRCLGFLYDREYRGRNVRRGGRGGDGDADGAAGRDRSQDRTGGLGPSALTVPDWINAIHELFPKRTVERLEKDALDRYHLEEVVTNVELLQRAAPNPTLLKAVLRTKHLMNQEVLAVARRLVRKVVEELMEKLARTIHDPFRGAVDRRRRSFLKIARNFDVDSTIRRNLRNWDRERRRIVIDEPWFFSRVRRAVDRWKIVVLVDESGSMLDSVIHAAVTAAVFFGIRTLQTHLVLFDTEVVDVTADCTDPVETLMKVQLGGGTDIGRALEHAAGLVEDPRRTIVVLITDFYEGGPPQRLYAAARRLIESGVLLLGCAALDERADPNYDRDVAARFVAMGAHVAAMTPGELAVWVAEKVR